MERRLLSLSKKSERVFANWEWIEDQKTPFLTRFFRWIQTGNETETLTVRDYYRIAAMANSQ